MFLKSSFKDAGLNETLQHFNDSLHGLFNRRLVSVILYGSAVFDDLAPGYGDLDFLTVVDGELSDDDCGHLVDLRRRLCDVGSPVYAKMLEGAFLPRAMLDPSRSGHAFWWGTSGERHWTSNKLGWFVLHVIRTRGLLIHGEDVSGEIPGASREQLFQEVRDFIALARKHASDGGLHAVDWLLTAARMLLWLAAGRLSSKTEAADWGSRNATGKWRGLLKEAAELRLNPDQAGCPKRRRWLAGLGLPINEACDELERALLAARAPRGKKDREEQ